jgi:opacity protein-like surface antigen
MLRAGTGGMLRTRLCSHPMAGRHSVGTTRWPVLMPISAVALMTGAPSGAYAQCFGSFNAIASAIGTVNTAYLPSGSAFLSSSPSTTPDQQGGGVWTRAVGGTVNTQADTNFSALFTVTPPNGPGFPVPLNIPCRASVKQNFAGFEAGHDIAVLNSGNSDMNWHFGVLAGYVGVKAETPQSVPTDSSQSGNFEAPSAGLYTAFHKANFSADVQARLYNLQADSLGQRLDARGYSFTGNVGYRFDLPGNWILEPSVGAIFSRTAVDQLNVADVTDALGVPVSGLPIFSPTTLAALSGTIQFHDIESALGRASMTLGTSLPLGGGQIVAYPFITGSVFHEFEGSVTASIATTGAFPTPSGAFQFQGSGNLTASSIGTYAQFGAGSAFQLADTGWLGYARVDYRTGDNIQGYSVSAGLRYQLENPSSVAENSVRNPKTASFKNAGPAGGYNWAGPYVGLSAGSTWGGMRWAFQGGTVDPDYAGYLAGGQAGYNFATGRFVEGIEADAGLSNARGARACPIQPLLFSCEDNVGALGSLTGRFGYTWGRALFYAKGGWAFGQVTAGTSLNFVDPALGLPPGGMNVARSTNWESGWTAGVGMEFALTEMWSAKAEYMHYEFSRYTFTVGQNATADAATAGDTVRIGVNYHFRP